MKFFIEIKTSTGKKITINVGSIVYIEACGKSTAVYYTSEDCFIADESYEDFLVRLNSLIEVSGNELYAKRVGRVKE